MRKSAKCGKITDGTVIHWKDRQNGVATSSICVDSLSFWMVQLNVELKYAPVVVD